MLVRSGCHSYSGGQYRLGFRCGIVGGIAVIALVLSVSGIRMAIRGFRERERNYLTCKIGLPANAAALILFFVIFIGGLR